MKKLLLVGTDTIHTLNYFNLIKDYFDEVFVITTAGGEKYKTKYKIINFSLKNPLNIKKAISSFKEIINKFEPSIIHIHQAGTGAYMCLKASQNYNVPTIVTAWGSDILHTPHKGYIYLKMIKYILNKADYFTSDSLFMAGEMSKLANKNIPILIANFGINIETNTNIKKENIIYSNRLHKSFYRIDRIIVAFEKFIKNRLDENWKLIIAATGEETENLKNLSKSLNLENDIEFVGWVDKQLNSFYYQKAKIFVSIPESDATSISLLEAISSNCISIVSNLPANYEWIVDELNGVIVVNESENFIEKAMKIDTDKMQAINNSLFKLKATKEINKTKFINLYKEILNEKK